jgi:predicted HTH transcriptional regulator
MPFPGVALYQRIVHRDLFQMQEQEIGEIESVLRAHQFSVPKNILKTVTAFANTAGGIVLIGIEDGSKAVLAGSTNRQADGPLTAEMRRSVLNLSYDEEAMPDINPDTLDVRVASGLFAGVRDCGDSIAENLHLVIRNQGRFVPTFGGILLFGTHRERYFLDAWIQYGRFRGANKAEILDQQDINDHLPLALEKAFDFIKNE